MIKLITAFMSLFLLACATAAKVPENATASNVVLIQSTQSWDGGDFAYPAGNAQLTVARIHIPTGVTLPLHCHPVPLGGVLSKGILEVTKEDGQKILLNKGEALIEVSRQWHHGHAVEEAEIIVVYAGAEGVPVTILKNDDPELLAQCH